MSDRQTASDPNISAYLLGQQEYNDRYDSLSRSRRNAWLIAGLASVACVIGVSFGAYQATARKYVPYVIAVDDLNNRALAPAPSKIEDWPPALVRREVSRFIKSLRSVTPDTTVQTEKIFDVYAYLGQGGLAHGKVTRFYKNPETDPKLRAEIETVAVDIETVTLQSVNTWNVEWREDVFERSSGQRTSSKRYRGSVVLTKTTVVNQETLRRNPLGLVLIDLDYQEVR